MQPETRYADSGGVNIAYQVVGDGPRDFVFVLGWVSNIEVFWEEPALVRFLTRLASFSRVILFDKRGTGLSDRVSDMPSLEVRMDDVRAVMDATGSKQATLFGVSEGGPMCALFSATYPSRVSALIMQGGFPRRIRTPDFPWGPTAEERRAWREQMRREWGGDFGLAARAPSMVGDERFARWWGRLLRMGASSCAFAQHRNGRVVAMQALGRHDMGLDHAPKRIERHSDGAHGVDHGGERDRRSLERIAVGLPVQRLMLAELLEHDHRRAGSGPPSPAGPHGTAPAPG